MSNLGCLAVADTQRDLLAQKRWEAAECPPSEPRHAKEVDKPRPTVHVTLIVPTRMVLTDPETPGARRTGRPARQSSARAH